MKKIALLLLTTLFVIILSACTNRATSAAAGDYIEIPLAEITGQLKAYSLTDDGVQIKYFVVLGSDGIPRTAFEACDVCGGDKGYEQQGNNIKCRKCGKVFTIDGLGTQNNGYGCWPSYLPNEIKGDNLLIKVEDIKNGRARFI